MVLYFKAVFILCLLVPHQCGNEIDTKELEKGKKEIESRIKEMDTAGIINDKKIDEKLGAIQKGLDSLTAKPEKIKGEKEVKAINSVIQGLPDLVAGIQTKNYQQTIIGTLKLTFAICVLIPPLAPIGTIGMTVLSSLTTVLSMFSDHNKHPKEDPFKKALENLRVEGLKDEIASVSHTWQTMISSVSQFEDFANRGMVISSDMATGFYSNSFKNVGIFGKMKSYIEEYCIVKDHSDPNSGEQSIKTCLDITSSYVKLSIMRGLILMRMGGIVQVAEKFYGDEGNEKKNKDKSDRMQSIRMNFIDLARKQREMDKEVLKVLADPLNSFETKRVIYEMYRTPYQYSVLLEYLRSLDDEFPGLIDDNHVIICPEAKLGGLCSKIGEKDDFQNWDNDKVPIQSWFVPLGIKFSGMDTNDKNLGPFIGMNVYSPITALNLKKIKVEKSSSKDSRAYIMICNTDEMCDSLPTEAGDSGMKITNYHGVNYNALKSIYVPRGFQVDVFDNAGSTTNKHGGPIFGPYKLKNLQDCYTSWNVIEYAPVESDKDGSKMVELCSPTNGFCVQSEAGSETESEAAGYFDFFRSSPVQCKPTQSSGALNLKIPQGRRITIQKDGVDLGPYTGPTYYPNLQVASLKIKVEDLWLDPKKAKKTSVFQLNKTDTVTQESAATTTTGQQQQNALNSQRQELYGKTAAAKPAAYMNYETFDQGQAQTQTAQQLGGYPLTAKKENAPHKQKPVNGKSSKRNAQKRHHQPRRYIPTVSTDAAMEAVL